MAAKGWILVLMLVCCALLPLLATSASDSDELTLDGGNDSPALLEFGLKGSKNDDDDVDFSKKKSSKDEKNKKDKKKKDKKKDKKKRKEDPIEPEPEPEPKPEPIPEPQQGAGEPNEPAAVAGGLQLGFYDKTCPQAEQIIQATMDKIFQRNVKIAPSLVRLFFHDCFVTGCDASILLDQTPSGEPVEKTAPQNRKFVRGFDEIEVKSRT